MEIVQAYDDWHEDYEPAAAAAGLTTASDASEQAYAIVDTLEQRLLATRAQTIDGVMAKVQVMCARPSNPAWLKQQLQAQFAKREGRDLPKAFMLSLALDKISMDNAGVIAA